MQDFNIQMTAATLESICEFAKRERGYDSARFSHVQQYHFEDKAEFFFSFRDDFQKDLAYDNQVKNGNMGFFASNPEELWSQILALPSRETRELGVMASRLAFAGDTLKARFRTSPLFRQGPDRAPSVPSHHDRGADLPDRP
jgi:hypothetical protein